MASSYPGSLDSLGTAAANATTTEDTHPAHHNDLADAVNKIEAALGTNPAAWSDWSPTWGNDGTANTVGNATITGRYTQIGSTVTFQLYFVFGSTSSAGNGAWNFDLPVTPASSHLSFPVWLLDSGTANYSCVGWWNGSAVYMAYQTQVFFGAGGPITWATGDSITITGTYET